MFESVATWSHEFLEKGDIEQVEKNLYLSLEVPLPSRKLPSGRILSSLYQTSKQKLTKKQNSTSTSSVFYDCITQLLKLFSQLSHFKTTSLSLS